MTLKPGQLIQAKVINHDLLQPPGSMIKNYIYMIIRKNLPLGSHGLASNKFNKQLTAPNWKVYDIANESYCNVYEETLILHYEVINK